MAQVRYNTINEEEDGQRLDNYLLRVLKGVPKSRIYRLIRQGEVRVNKKRAKPSSRLAAGDLIRLPPIRDTSPKTVQVHAGLGDYLQQQIIFEDTAFLVLNKPAGLAVHGGSGLSLGLIEALRQCRQDIPYLELAHRLDKNTSGCIILAKKRSALRALQALWADQQVKKTYWALLMNRWQGPDKVEVNAPLLKNQLQSGERIVTISSQGKTSKTWFNLVENFQQACLVAASPITGRTHQIRVHSAYLHHPIIGDEKYNKISPLKELLPGNTRMYLHARDIQFTLNDTLYSFQADLDESFSKALVCLRS